jgi:hypothetical protein
MKEEGREIPSHLMDLNEFPERPFSNGFGRKISQLVQLRTHSLYSGLGEGTPVFLREDIIWRYFGPHERGDGGGEDEACELRASMSIRGLEDGFCAVYGGADDEFEVAAGEMDGTCEVDYSVDAFDIVKCKIQYAATEGKGGRVLTQRLQHRMPLGPRYLGLRRRIDGRHRP